jgi:hypothetical protein
MWAAMADDENPALGDVAAGGDRRALLEAIRDRLAAELSRVDGRDVVVLVKELRSVIRELDTLPPAAGRETPLDRIEGAIRDDLAERRAARVADAAGS